MSYRILVITPWFPDHPGDGRFNFILHSVEALQRAGNQVTVLVTRPFIPRICRVMSQNWDRAPLQMNEFSAGFDLHLRQHLSIPGYYLPEAAAWFYRLGCASAVRQLIRKHSIQLIHAHTEQAGLTAASLAEEFGIPSVMTLHGIDTAPRKLDCARKRKAMWKTLCAAKRVILVGEPLHQFFAPLAGRDDHFRVVPNGFFFPESLTTRKRIDTSESLKIVSISNLQEGKGVALSIRALHLLKEQGWDNWSYTVVGDGPEATVLKKLVQDLKLNDQIAFRGALPHNQALQALTEAEVFLLPSYREAFGVAYLEGMAAGLLTIGVQGQGPEAFICHGETGYLVPPQDIEAISRLLQTIIKDRAAAAGIAAAGQEHVKRNFTWDRHAEKLMGVYYEVAGDSI